MLRSLKCSLTSIAITAFLLLLAWGWLNQAGAADIALSWNDNSNNETGFSIERKTGTNGTFAQIATVGANVESYVNSGLATATTFCYRVRAYNSAGFSAYTPQACKTTPSASSTSNFDFSLSHGGDKSVLRGKSVSNLITAAHLSGSSASISFSTAGFPAGSTASYTTSSSCNPTCSRTLNIATSSSTPTGTYPITVIGSGGGVIKRVTFNLTVASTTVAASSFQFSLANGGNKSVIRGQSTSNLITATLVSGSTRSVSFSSSGLPPGATASYASSSSCSPTCSRTMNITTSTSTPTGNYQITATVAGTGITKTTSFSLTVTTGSVASGNSGNTISVEAEAGTVTAPMVIRSDAQASGGKFAEVPEGKGNSYRDSTSGGPGQIRFAINVLKAGTRRVWARTIATNGGSDSFYVTRNGTLLRKWFVPHSSAWRWNNVGDFSFPAGSVSLAFRQREDGTKLDRIILTTDPNFNPNNGALASVSGGSGQSGNTITVEAESGNAITVEAESGNAITVEAESGSAITVEAESGNVTAPMMIRSNATASGGKFAEVPEGKGNSYRDSTSGGPGQIRFAINVLKAGTRRVWARTIATNGGSDSFYVTRNGTLLRKWSVPRSSAWRWNNVGDFSFPAGSVSLAFRQREDGTKLDKIILTRDLNFDPNP